MTAGRSPNRWLVEWPRRQGLSPSHPAAGSASAMSQFYREMAGTNPTELFHDPMGGIKHGRNIGAISGHGDHVHLAY